MEKVIRYPYGSLMLILLFTIVLRMPTLFEPWGGDQGVFGYIANGILEGKIPYRDMYTSTGYGIYFIYAFFFKIFGTHMAALHMGDLTAVLILVALVHFLVFRVYGKDYAFVAALLVALFISGSSFSGMYDLKGAWGTYWQLAQREIFMAPLITAAILIMILADRKQNWFSYTWVGGLIGLAVVLKFTAFLVGIFLICFVMYAELFREDGSGIKLCVIKIISFVFGFVVIQLPFLYYFWVHDSLGTMYNAVFVHTSIYAGLSRGNIIANAFQGNTFIIRENIILWVFSMMSALYLFIHDRKRENILILVWALASLFMVWGQGKFFGYHYLLIIPPFSVLTGFGIIKFLKVKSKWLESIWSSRNDIQAIFLWLLIAFNLAAYFVINYEYYKWHGLYFSGKITKSQYYEVFNEYPLHLYSFRSDNDIANYIKTNGQNRKTIRTINCGGDTILHFLTGFDSPTRFTSTWYLFNPTLYYKPITEKLRRELIKGIKAEKPDYILLVYYTMDEFKEQSRVSAYSDVAELMDYIDEEYVLEKMFRDGRSLYRKL